MGKRDPEKADHLNIEGKYRKPETTTELVLEEGIMASEGWSGKSEELGII